MKKFLKLFATLLVVLMVLSVFVACDKQNDPDNPVDNIPNENPVHEHAWDAGEVTKEATCTEEGEKTFKCTGCDETKVEKIAALGHTWGEGTVTKAATCKEAGEKEFTCTVCGEKKTEAVEKLAHTWDEGKVTKAATTDAEGEKTFKCTVCGETKTETIAKISTQDGGSGSASISGDPNEITIGPATYVLNADKETYTLNKFDENYEGDTYVVLDSVNGGKKVTAIYEDAFSGLTQLTKITIGANVTEIGDNAFRGTAIMELKVPNGVTKIGENAFADCKALQVVTIGDRVETLPVSAFSGCEQIAILTLGNGLTTLTNSHFSDANDSLVKVTLGENLTSIGGAFEDALDSKLVVVKSELGADVLGAAVNAKAEATYTKKLELVITDEGYVFFTDKEHSPYPVYLMTYLGKGFKADPEDEEEELDLTQKTLILPASYGSDEDPYSIYQCAFLGRADIKTVKMAELSGTAEYKLNKIGDFAFYDCDALTDVTLPTSVTTFGEAVFAYCDGLTEITLPTGITTISDRTFEGCQHLTTVNIPSTVTAIGRSAFESCWDLATITIPASVTQLGIEAFCNCGALVSIVYGGTKAAALTAISGATDWDSGTGNYVVTCTDGKICKNHVDDNHDDYCDVCGAALLT